MVDYEVPIADPFLNRGENYLIPNCENSKLLESIGHIYRDIMILQSMITQFEKPYAKKLLLKYLIIEFYSIDKKFTQLCNNVFKLQRQFEVDKNDLKILGNFRKKYNRIKKPIGAEIAFIRNRIAAHRDDIDYNEIAEYWDKINIELVSELIETIEKAYPILAKLNIYNWYKTETDDGNIIECFIQPINPNEFQIEEES